jgi:hypothetical protein
VRASTLSTFVLPTLLLLGVVIVVPNYLYSQGYASLQEVAELQIVDRLHLTERMHELSHASQYNLTDDYTYWDDMIAFADGKLDDAWGEENLRAGIATFNVDAIWVIDRAGRVRYGIVTTPDGDIRRETELPIGMDIIEATAASGSIGSFHHYVGDRLVTIMTAGLVPTDDIERTTPPQGYFVTLSEFDTLQISTLGTQTGTEASVHRIGEPTRELGLLDAGTGLYRFRIPVADWDGTEIAHIYAERHAESIATLHAHLGSERVTNYTLFSLVSVLMLVLLWVNIRARRRAELIAEGMTRDLRDINATLERRVTERTAQLEHDIKRRTEAEEDLRKRTEELERLNRVMVDRELRVVELKKRLKGMGEGSDPA